MLDVVQVARAASAAEKPSSSLLDRFSRKNDKLVQLLEQFGSGSRMAPSTSEPCLSCIAAALVACSVLYFVRWFGVPPCPMLNPLLRWLGFLSCA